MYFEIDPKSKLGKRAQSIANYYRNLTGAKGCISRKVRPDKWSNLLIRVTVSKNNLLGLTYVTYIPGGKRINLSIKYGKLDASIFTTRQGWIDLTEIKAKRLLKKLFESEFANIPPNVEIETVMRAA